MAANDVGELALSARKDCSPRWTISTDGGSQPRWSPNGRELLYLRRAGTLASRRVSALRIVQETRRISDAPQGVDRFDAQCAAGREVGGGAHDAAQKADDHAKR
jgi:hypothetical protein